MPSHGNPSAAVDGEIANSIKANGLDMSASLENETDSFASSERRNKNAGWRAATQRGRRNGPLFEDDFLRPRLDTRV
jgi:hypothetical protein